MPYRFSTYSRGFLTLAILSIGRLVLVVTPTPVFDLKSSVKNILIEVVGGFSQINHDRVYETEYARE